MAKNSLKINDFSGGINLYSDSKDIEDNEFTESRSLSNNINGKLQLAGGLDGQVFKPSSSSSVTSFVSNGDTDFSRGYGLLALNLDLPVYDDLQVTFEDNFDSLSWTGTVSTSSTVTVGSSGALQLETAAVTSAYARAKIDLSSKSISDGALVACEIEISGATGYTSTEHGNLKVYFGTSSTQNEDDIVFQTGASNHKWSNNSYATNDILMIVGRWGSNGEFLHIHNDKVLGAASAVIAINKVTLKVIPEDPSLNLFFMNGDGSISRNSYIKTDDYDGGVKVASTNDIIGESPLGGAFSNTKVDMTHNNNVVKISNDGELAEWFQVDRSFNLPSSGNSTYESSSSVRTIQTSSYSKDPTANGLGMIIDDNYEMLYPRFMNSSSATASPNEGAESVINPYFQAYNATLTTWDETESDGWDHKGLRFWMADGQAPGTDIDDSMKKVWRFGASLLIDDEQLETKITWHTSVSVDLTNDTKMPKVGFHYNHFPGKGFVSWNSRVTGFRIWMSSEIDANSTSTPNPILAVECSFLDNTYTMFGTSEINYTSSRIQYMPSYLRSQGFTQLDAMPSITFDSLHAYFANEELYSSYKTSDIIGSYQYIGNVKINGISKPDRIIRSEEFGFDIFPENNFLSIAPNDGDTITAIKSFGSELVVFKKDKVFVIGCDTPGEETFEGEWPGVGILNPCQACKTEFGVVWINGSGLYVYDGSDVKSLSMEKMPANKLGINTSRDFVALDEGNIPIIGYSPLDKKIIYSIEQNNNNFMMYDTTKESFQPSLGTYAYNSSGIEDVTTNFINVTSIYDRKNYLLYGTKHINANPDDEIIYLRHYVDDPVATKDGRDFLYVSKNFDFGNPTTKKKIYGVYVTYKTASNSGEAIPVFAINSDAPTISRGDFWDATATRFDSTNSYFIGQGSSDLALNSDTKGFNNSSWTGRLIWRTAYLKPSTSLNAVYTFQFAITGNSTAGGVNADFQINDVTIIYREKGQK